MPAPSRKIRPVRSNSHTIRIGIGGWVFAPWRETFYPPGLRASEFLPYASRQLTSIEVNATYYRTQTAATFRAWRDATPDGFAFSVKGPRAATQPRDAARAAPAVERFLASGLTELGAKLGPIAWQFPPTRRFEAGELAAFLDLLPRGARRLHAAPRHRGRARELPTRPNALALLRGHGVARVLLGLDGDTEPADTADFVYARLKGTVPEEPTRVQRRRARRLGRPHPPLERAARLLRLRDRRRQGAQPGSRPGADRADRKLGRSSGPIVLCGVCKRSTTDSLRHRGTRSRRRPHSLWTLSAKRLLYDFWVRNSSLWCATRSSLPAARSSVWTFSVRKYSHFHLQRTFNYRISKQRSNIRLAMLLRLMHLQGTLPSHVTEVEWTTQTIADSPRYKQVEPAMKLDAAPVFAFWNVRWRSASANARSGVCGVYSSTHAIKDLWSGVLEQFFRFDSAMDGEQEAKTDSCVVLVCARSQFCCGRNESDQRVRTLMRV